MVGTPQAQHFQMLFAASKSAEWLDEARRVVHVGFGSVLGEDGKMLRSRSGETITLADLLSEAVDRAHTVLTERSELPDHLRADVARSLGVGAVKYADLSSDREKDYVFAWDKMLAQEGNTSVYLQYANARVLSVIRKAGGLPTTDVAVRIEHRAERALLIKLLRFPAVLASAVEGFAPHRLCTHLHETAAAFSVFYENCPVIKASDVDLRASRLALAGLTSRVLTTGLDLLGIDAPTKL